MSTLPVSTLGVRAILRSRHTHSAQPLTEVVPTPDVVVSKQGQQIIEQDAPSSRLVNLLEQQEPRSRAVEAEALRVQRLLRTSAGTRSVLRTR
jgi:hypothetical protein